MLLVAWGGPSFPILSKETEAGVFNDEVRIDESISQSINQYVNYANLNYAFLINMNA